MCAVTLVHTHVRTPRHWIKVWTHTVSGVCVTLCVLAKPVKRNHSSRNVHFAQRSLISTVTQAVKFQRRFCLLTSEHISSLRAAPPGLCDRQRNGFYSRCSFSTNTRPYTDAAAVKQMKMCFFYLVIVFMCGVICIFSAPAHFVIAVLLVNCSSYPLSSSF